MCSVMSKGAPGGGGGLVDAIEVDRGDALELDERSTGLFDKK